MNKKVNYLFAALFVLFVIWLIIVSLSKKNYDCIDFKTQEEAQKVFKSHITDIYYLDGDDDGIACELLP